MDLESKPLLGGKPAAPLQRATNPRASKSAKALASTVLLFGGLAIAGVHQYSSSSKTTLETQPEPQHTDAAAKPSIALSNAYERSTGNALGDGLYPYDHLAEVHKSTSFAVQSPSDLCSYVWGAEDASVLSVEGAHAEIMFNKVGWHTVQLTVDCRGSESVTHSYSVMSKHVRRELRGLTDEDADTFFTTLKYVYDMPQHEGEKLHGKKYRNIHRLVADHLLGAADKECDHWHDDAGIMTHHIAFTLEMEQALQSVNANVTIPYWDYTIDAYEYSDHNWVDSPVFADDWFGKASPGGHNHVITTGRWAFQEVGKQADPDGVRNPYGLLRSPWNTNPMPYLLRHRYVYNERDGGWTMPGCVDFRGTWEETWLGDYFSELNGKLHGPVHIMIGGQWDANMSAGYNFSATNGGDFLLASKWLWRQGYLRCPETCSSDTPAEACVCSCPAELSKDFSSAVDFLGKTGLMKLSDGLFSNWRNFATTGCKSPNECYEIVVKALCHVGHAGEMFTSAAPYDPTFWPIHGLADRFLQLKRVKVAAGTTTLNETWGYYHDGNSPSDTHHVCDWSNVEAGSMQMPTCTPGSCAGHRRDDLMPFSNFLGQGETYTNIEFYNFMSPFNEDLPYVYDSLTSWPACTEQEMPFWEK